MIELLAISKSFDDGRTFAVRDVSLTVPDGAFVAVVGASGSGKTTLVKTINRLVEPDAGEVLIDGARADADPASELRRRIGYVFQGVGLFPHMTLAENIGVTPRLLRWTGDQIAARVDELLDLVALPRAYAARRPDELSGGQRQRVGLARALAARPSVMLLDEPFGALDAVTRDSLGQDYRDLHARLGLTTVMITHDILEAALLADRMAVMKDGRLIAEDAPAALLAGHADPDVRALMETTRRQAERVAGLVGASHG